MILNKIILIYCLLPTLNRSQGIEVDKNLGIISQNCSTTSILTAGETTVSVELEIVIPQIRNHGSCNLLDIGAQDSTIGKIAPHFNDSDHADWDKERFGLASSMAFMVQDSNRYLRDKIKKDLQLEEKIIFPVSLEFTEFDNNPRICNDERVHCTFELGFNIATPCQDSKGNNMKVGFVRHSMRIPVISEKDSSSRWKNHCGIIQGSQGSGENEIYTVGPGLCCSLSNKLNEGHCPRQAAALLQDYNSRAKQNGLKLLVEDKAYCLSITNIQQKADRGRRKRSEFFHYWSEGGALNPNYILEKVHSEKTWTNTKLRDIETQVMNLNDNILKIGHGVSRTVDQIEAKLCKSQLNSWGNIIREEAFEITTALESEIRSIISDCEQNRLPLMVNRTELTHLCAAVSGSKEINQCEPIDSLAKCAIKGAMLEGNSIMLQLDVSIKLPVTDSKLECSEKSFFSIPARSLRIFNIPELQLTNTEAEQAIKRISESSNDESADDVITLLRDALLTISNNTRTRRDLDENRLFHYFKINLPSIKVFYIDERPSQKVAFKACKEKLGVIICELGGPDEYFNHSVCVEGLISNNRQKILHTCPAVIRSGSPCEFKKLDQGVIVSAHETIKVQKLGRRKTLGTFTQPQPTKCENQDVCVVERDTGSQEILCNNLRFLVDAQRHKLIHTRIDEVSLNVTFSDLEYKGFHNEDLHQVAKLSLPFSKDLVASGHSFTNILFLIAVCIGIISIIGICYKITRCCYDLVRCGSCITSTCQRCFQCCQSQQDAPTNQRESGGQQSGSPAPALPLLEYRA